MNRKTIFLCLIFSFASTAFLNTANAQIAPGSPKAPSAAEMKAQQVEVVRSAIAESKARTAKLTGEIDSAIEKLRLSSVSDIAYEDVVRMLHLQKVELTIDLEGLGARMKLLKEKTEETIADGQTDTEAQRQLLKRHVANQEQEWQKLKKLADKGSVPQESVRKAELLMKEAKLRLKLFNTKQKTPSPTFVKNILETALSIGEKQAKLAAVEKMLSSHTNSREVVSAIEELRGSLVAEKISMQDLIQQLRRMEQENLNMNF